MKKLSFVLALALAGTMNAQTVTEHVNNLNPYAYGVDGQVKAGKVALKYNLNAPADSTKIAIYRDGEEVGTVAIEDNAMGMHSTVIDLASYTEGGTYTVGVRVYGNGTRTVAEQLVNVAENGDTIATNYTFWHARGLAVDKNPYSANFGRILTGESQNDTPAEGYWQSGEGQGLVAFDATFAPIPNGNQRTYKMGLDLTQNKAPFRMVISDDSRIFMSARAENLELIYEVAADLQSATPLVAGALLNEKKAQNVSLDIKCEEGNITLLAVNTTADGNGANGYDNVYEVAEYDLSGAEPVKTLPFGETTLKSIVDANGFTTTLTDFMTVKYDGNGGYWYANSRSAVTECQFAHISAEGVASLQAVDGGFYGGGGICVDGDKLYVGADRYSPVNGHIVCYTVGADAAGNVTLTKDYDIKAWGIGRNINEIAIDYAHNLYAVGNSNEKLVAIMLPYSGMVETPVAAELVKEGVAVEEVEAAPVVEKFIENGQVVIVKDGVRYNALGARL